MTDPREAAGESQGLSTTDPAALVGAIQARDRAAEDELVRRYRPGVRSIVRQVVGLHPELDDLVQDTLLLVLEKARRGEIREPARLSGFVSATARNVGIAFLRKHSRMEPWDGSEALDSRSDALSGVLQRELADTVRKVLSALLQTRDREILYRFYVEEEAKESICRRLGLSDLHFNRVLYRARERFREMYEKSGNRRDKPPVDIT